MNTCGCLTESGSKAIEGVCQQDALYDGLCWYHYKMSKGLLEPSNFSRSTATVSVKKPGYGRIFPFNSKFVFEEE